MVLGRLPLAVGLALWVAVVAGVAVRPAAAQKAEADVFVARAMLAFDEKRYEDALENLREALTYDPENVDALYYTGLVRTALGRLEEAIQPLEKARALDPKDEAILFQLGVTYFGLQKYDQAQPLLERVFASQPRVENLGYYVGFMRYRKKDYRGALQAFSAGTTTDPNVQQLTRFYTGLALAILGLPERAAAEVEQALKLQPGSPLTGPAERLRDTILATAGRRRSFLYEACKEKWGEVCDRFTAEVRLGFLYDTNVAVEPEPSHDPIAESLRLRKNRSPGELGGVRLEYAWLRKGPWEGTIGYSLFQVRNDALPKFNIQNHLGSVGGSYKGALAELPYQVGLQYAYDYLTLGSEQFLQRHTATFSTSVVEGDWNLTTLLGRLQTKQFATAPHTPHEEERDATNWMVGFAHVFHLGEKHFLRVGYQYDFEDADGRNFQYAGNRYQVGAQATLPWRVLRPRDWGEPRLKYDLDLHLRYYPHKNNLLPATRPDRVERRDEELVHVVRLEQPLPGSLTLSLEYQTTIARSNLVVFSFNRTVYSLILSWQY